MVVTTWVYVLVKILLLKMNIFVGGGGGIYLNKTDLKTTERRSVMQRLRLYLDLELG